MFVTRALAFFRVVCNNHVVETRGSVYTFLGARVKKLRLAKPLTQAQLAKAVGVTRASIANIEAGRQKLSVDRLCDLGHALGVTPDALLPRESSKTLDEKLVELGGDRAAARWIQAIAA